KCADAMGRLTMTPGQKWPTLNFSPTDAAFGKNPGQLPPLQVPEISTDPAFLGNVIDQIKAKLNELTDAQREAQEWMGMWRTALEGAESAQAYTDLITD